MAETTPHARSRPASSASRRDEDFPRSSPLLAPGPASRHRRLSLIGVLAVGPPQSGPCILARGAKNLTSLADQAGTALYVAQLFEESRPTRGAGGSRGAANAAKSSFWRGMSHEIRPR